MMRRGKEYGDGFGNEMRFWLENLTGHGRIIAERTVGLGETAEQAEEFSYVFARFGQRLDKVKGVRKTEAFLRELTDVTQDFMTYQSMLVTEKLNGRLGENIKTFALEHMYRESECWQLVLSGYDGEKMRRVIRLSEVVGWFTAAAEHIVIIRQSLEPAEQRLNNMFIEYEREWLTLASECRQLAGMAARHHIGTEALRVFASEVRPELNEFMKTCQMLCEIKGVGRPVAMLSAYELTHIKNESEHFLYLLSLLNRYGVTELTSTDEADIELCTVDYTTDDEETAATFVPDNDTSLSEAAVNERAGGDDEPVIAVINIPSDSADLSDNTELAATNMAFDNKENNKIATPIEESKPDAAAVATDPVREVSKNKKKLVLPRQMTGVCPVEQLTKNASTRIRPLGSK